MASAVRAVLRRGWLQPDVKILTTAFVVPGLLFGAVAIFGPVQAARLVLHYMPRAEPQTAGELATFFRLSYPLTMLAAFATMTLLSTIRIFRVWTARIRDEAYLIGERLHNFGVGAAGAASTRGQWKVRGARL
jgi:E3 ubiquitin-protein ligase MARCH6